MNRSVIVGSAESAGRASCKSSAGVFWITDRHLFVMDPTRRVKEWEWWGNTHGGDRFGAFLWISFLFQTALQINWSWLLKDVISLLQGGRSITWNRNHRWPPKLNHFCLESTMWPTKEEDWRLFLHLGLQMMNAVLDHLGSYYAFWGFHLVVIIISLLKPTTLISLLLAARIKTKVFI